MRRTIHIVSSCSIALCCFLNLSCSDDGGPTSPSSPAPTFMHRLDMSEADQFRSVEVLDDGTILAGGSVERMRIDTSASEPDTMYDTDAVLVRFEANGDSLWSSAYGEPDHYEVVTVVAPAISNGYVTVGESTPYGPDTRIFCKRVLETGETGWSVTSDQGRFDYPSDIITTADDSYVLAGHISSTMGYPRVSLIKISQGGDLEWERAFSLGDTTLSAIEVRELPDAHLLVAAGFDIRNESFHNAGLLELNATGELLSAFHIPLHGSQDVHDVAIIPDGGYRLVGRHNDGIRTGFFMVTIDSLDAIQSVRFSYLDTFFWIEDGMFTADGGAVLCGREAEAGLLVKLDFEGAVSWERRFEIAGGAVKLFDVDEHLGGYVIAGQFYADDHSNHDMVLIRTDRGGGVDEVPTALR